MQALSPDVWPEASEGAVIGAALVNAAALKLVTRELPSGDMYRAREQKILATIHEMHAAGQAVDVLTVSHRLPAQRDYLHALCDTPFVAANVREYIAAVRSAAAKRRLKEAAIRLAEKVAASNGDVSALLDDYAKTAAAAVERERNATALPATITAADLFASPETQLDMLCAPYFAFGTIGLLAAFAKDGKSELLRHAIRAALTGGLFLDKRAQQRRTLLLSEEGRRTTRRGLERAGIAPTDDLHIMFRAECTHENAALAERVAALVRHYGFGFVIVDTIGAWLGVEDENDAMQIQQALQAWRPVAEMGACLWFAAHARKAAGRGVNAVRGSSALAGAVDCVLTLRRLPDKPAHRRELCAYGRFDDLPETVQIELRDGEYRLLGESGSVTRSDQRSLVLSAIPATRSEAVTAEQVEAALGGGLKRTAIYDVLRGLVNDGVIVQEKGANPAHPRSTAYWRAEP